MMLVVRSNKSAERRNSPYEERNHGRGKAYVALLVRGPRDTVDRRFISRRHHGNTVEISIKPSPGDIYEIRNWTWDGLRHCYLGGTSYVGFDEYKNPHVLTRDEAFANVLTSPYRRAGVATLPTVPRAERIMPRGVTVQ